MNEDYTILCSKELKRKYKKNKILNFIGYLIYRWNGYGNQRRGNDGWFYMSTKELVDELGFSKTTIKKFEDKLILDGMIEKRSGDFSARKANEYRVLFDTGITQKCTDDGYTYYTKSVPSSSEKCTDTESVQFTSEKCTEKCTEGGIDNEVVTEKSVPSKLLKKCTTDIDSYTEIDKETINKQKVVNYNTVLVSSSDSCEIETTDTNQPKELITDENKPEEVLQQLTTFFTFDERFKSYNEKLLSKAPHYSINKQPSFEERGEGGKWFWSKWKTYSEWVKTSNLSFEEVDQYNKTFLHLFTYYYKPKKLTNEKEKKFEEYKDNLMKQMKGVMHVYIFNRWKEFLENLDKYDNQTCKRFRYAFMKKADKWFKGEESYSDVCDMMDKEYFNSFVSTHKSNADITAVDQLFDAGYDLQEATEYLQATNLTSKQIKERWDELSTPSEEPLIKTRTERAVATVNLDAKPYDYGASGMAQ